MIKSKFFVTVFLASLVLLLTGVFQTASSQTDYYEGGYTFYEVTKGNANDAPDYISLKGYDGDQITVACTKHGQWGHTNIFEVASQGVFEKGFGRPGYEGVDKSLGIRITFLNADKFTYYDMFKGVKATYVRQ
jgi:hypothetical protein